MSYHFAFSYCSWGSQGKNNEVVCHSRLQWTTFFQTSPPWPICLGWPHTAWLSFIELDTTVVLWADWLISVIMVLVCLPSDALSQHLPSYLGFSYLGRGVSLQGCSSKEQPLLLTLDEGYLLRAAPPDLGHGVAPLGPPASHSSRSLELGLLLLAAVPDLGHVVALLSCHPWPWRWGSSFRPPLLRCHNLALSVTTPDLKQWIAPHGQASAWPVAAGALLHLTLCNPMDYTIHGIFQAWILEWVAFPFPGGSSQPSYRTQVSHIAGGFFTC